jgi:hypothetical protein
VEASDEVGDADEPAQMRELEDLRPALFGCHDPSLWVKVCGIERMCSHHEIRRPLSAR